MPRSWLPIKEVMARAGLARSTIYAAVKEGRFPKPVRVLQGHASRWDSDDLDAWFDAAKAREETKCQS